MKTRLNLSARQANNALAALMGLTMGLAIAFFVFAMPIDLFETLINASGLPLIVEAAQPPLGATARAIVASCAGLVAGCGVAALLLPAGGVGSSRVDLQACKLEYSIVSPK